jgi:nitrate/nitrite transporter NarK
LGWCEHIFHVPCFTLICACVSNSTALQHPRHDANFLGSTITGSTSNIREPLVIALLTTGVALIPVFIFWVGRQERLGRPAIIPNSLWRNRVFTSICLSVFLTWGFFNAVENLLTFIFQYVQGLSAIQASLRFLPAPISGALTNLVMGMIVHRVRADYVILISSGISCLSPMLIALINPKSSYWAYEFPAVALNPIGADALFTISNLLITSVFPPKTQALAGGVFNTVAQIGKSVGLATSAVIASSVTMRSDIVDKESPEGLLIGYKAAFWYCFALCLSTMAVSAWGLRSIGKVGMKRD